MSTLTSGQAAVNGRDPTKAEADAVAKLIGHPPENAPKRRRTVRVLYAPIDIHGKAEVWPETVPPLTAEEAIKAGKLLYRRFYQMRWYQEKGRKPPHKLTAPPPTTTTSGNRNNWAHRGRLIVNPSGGWKRLVHELSHYFHQKLRPHDKPHSDSHRHLEKEMIAHVVSSGWLDGKLKPRPKAPKPVKPPVDPVALELERIAVRTKAWTTKARRAATALTTLKKREAVLRRRVTKAAAQVRFSLSD